MNLESDNLQNILRLLFSHTVVQYVRQNDVDEKGCNLQIVKDLDLCYLYDLFDLNLGNRVKAFVLFIHKIVERTM